MSDREKSQLRALPPSIWALFAVRLIIAAGNFVFPFLTLILTSRLGWSSDRAGIFLSLMQGAALPGLFLGGRLSDLVGRKKIILLCQAVAALLFFCCLAIGFTPVVPFLIAGASIALSMTWPVSGALVADLVPAENRKSAYALLYWGNNIGFSLGPLAAGFLFHRAPGLMFLGNACALCISIFILARFVPEPRITVPTSPAPPAADTATGAMARTPAGAPLRGPNHPEAAWQGGLWSVLKARPSILMFSALVAMMNFVYNQHTFSLPLHLNATLGLRGAEIFGSAMTVNGLTVVLCTLLLSRLTSRTPVLLIMTIASLLYGIGFGLLALPPSFLLVLVSTIVWTWGEILSATNINVYVAAKTPASHRGRVNSLVSIVTNIGSLSGPVIAGTIIRGGGTGAVWPVTFFASLVAAALMMGLGLFDRLKGPGSAHP